MKLSAILFTVIVLLAGTVFIACSFSAKDKVRADTTTDSKLILPETSLKKDTTVPLSNLVNKQNTSPKKAPSDLIEVYIAPSICEGTRNDFDVIPPPPVDGDSIRVQNDDSVSFFMCNIEEEAEYPGGAEAWHRFLNENLEFPTDSSGKGIQGAVDVTFMIDEEGNVCNVEAVSGLKILGAEAVRVIKNSSKWTPAKLYSNGRHVKSYKKQPVMFRM
jgi:TonB family protein